MFDELVLILAAENCKMTSGRSYQDMAEFCVEQAGAVLRAREEYIRKENL